MTRQCDSCGHDYEAQRVTSRFCTPKCRKRGSRSPTKAVGAPSAPPRDPATSGLLLSTLAALEAAACLETPLGQLAVEITLRILNPAETGSAVAALTKQLRDTLAAALSESEVVVEDPLDELRRRRDNKSRVS